MKKANNFQIAQIQPQGVAYKSVTVACRCRMRLISFLK